MYSDFVFLDRFLFELSCKNTHTPHRDSNEYPIVAFSKNATIIKKNITDIKEQEITRVLQTHLGNSNRPITSRTDMLNGRDLSDIMYIKPLRNAMFKGMPRLRWELEDCKETVNQCMCAVCACVVYMTSY